VVERADTDGQPSRAGLFGRRLVLGALVLAISWLAGQVLRRRRIRAVDLTAPDPFGAAVVRE
jgi:hypothetical protein